jgi:hypothetical protein
MGSHLINLNPRYPEIRCMRVGPLIWWKTRLIAEPGERRSAKKRLAVETLSL